MNTSESINELATALCKAQSEIGPAAMNATNPFLKNRYADLNSIVEAIKPALANNGLSYVQMPGIATSGEFGIALTTRLMHESGQWLEDTFIMPMPTDERGKSIMQVAGSAISYARRYALAAMLGVVADEDVDGNGQQRQTQKQQRKPDHSTDHTISVKSTLADIRAELAGSQTVKLGLVADRATQTGKYNSPQHALNAMKGFAFPDGVNVAMSQTVSGNGAAQVFDWLMECKSE